MVNKRAGIGIGIISRGNVSIKWMAHMDKLRGMTPIGMFSKYIIVEGMSYADGRNEVVRRAKKENFEWLMFIDDDVFIPEDAFRRMVSRQKDIVTGIYWTKTEHTAPVIFEEIGKGPMYDFPLDSLFEVAGSGLGCCLINMKVFDEFDKAGLQYFKENWVMTLDNGTNMKCPIGEDHYFFYQSRKLGFKIWADSGILCDHYDMVEKKSYPSPDIVRQYTGQKLKEVGREDLIQDYENTYGLDKNKRTVVFIDPNRFSGDELERRAVGGAETALINISQLFATELNTHVFSDCEPGLYNNVVYHHIKDLTDLNKMKTDLLIVNRVADIFVDIDFKTVAKVAKTALWCHDTPNSPAYYNLDKAISKIDKIIVLSDWHKKEFINYFKFIPEDRFIVLRNGVDTKRFLNKVAAKTKGSLIYSSTPFRGLDILAEVFPEIRRRVPHATLKVFSSLKLYGENYNDDEFEPLYNALKHMDGVEYFGSIDQDRLAQEMLNSEILAYPNTYPETYCITAIEAISAGTPIVTSNYAALPEVVTDDVGIKIEERLYSQEYKKAFVDAIVELLTNDEKLFALKSNCLTKNFDWSLVYHEWKKLLDDVDSVYKHGNINTQEYWDKTYQADISRGFNRGDFERYNIILDKIKAEYQNPKILDIGCGMGEFTREARKRFPDSEIWGSDFSMVAIDHCRQENRTIFYANHPIMNDEFDKHYFDVITIQHVLEHLDKPMEMINRAKELLKENGLLIIVMPVNDEEWKEHLKIWTYEDIKTLANEISDNNSVLFRTIPDKIYKNGRHFEEAIIYLR